MRCTVVFIENLNSQEHNVLVIKNIHFPNNCYLLLSWRAKLFTKKIDQQISDGEYLFAEPDSKLSKYAPKSWRSSHSHGLDANGRPALEFYFRVQFYVDSPLLLRDETTRHHYYLQLRLNAASGAAGDQAPQLAGLALQADLGDYNDNTTYQPEDYVPPNVRGPAALRAIETAYRSHRLLSKAEARSKYIAEACQLQEPVNAHVFRYDQSRV